MVEARSGSSKPIVTAKIEARMTRTLHQRSVCDCDFLVFRHPCAHSTVPLGRGHPRLRRPHRKVADTTHQDAAVPPTHVEHDSQRFSSPASQPASLEMGGNVGNQLQHYVVDARSAPTRNVCVPLCFGDRPETLPFSKVGNRDT